ncbi:LysR family transcriptional regulator [Salinibacillus aidingensis]|uniref:LysR family transcriptional regulator n=1 Tax=Salinibacillus aidingensis TaxID=237684 RepID=A0ABP3KZV0_9BACI
MDIRQLEYFSEVARQSSFTKAAASLHVSQPSLSKAIKNLEGELGVPLFYRAARQVYLTDAGKAVFMNAKHVLESFNNLTAELTDIMELKKGEIRIGIPPIVGAAFFAKLISRFKELYPLIDLTLREVGTKAIKQGVKEGSLDIGLVCNLPDNNQEFEKMEIVKDPLMLVVHHENPLVRQENVYFGDLKDESFILYRNDFSLYDHIIEECSRHQFSPSIVCESSQKEFMLEMVSSKLGIALLPKKICEDISHPAIRTIPLEESPLHLGLGMIWSKNRYLPFSVREFIHMSERVVDS